MRELAAKCGGCGKDLYCRDGFFEGEIDKGTSFCLPCFKQLQSDFTEEEVGRFIAELNNKPDSHTGYCGTQAEEVTDTLLNDFSDLSFKDSFTVLKEDGKMIAALGADWNSETKTGELWGPFSFAEEGKWQQEAEILWRMLQHKIHQKGKWYGFYNEQNEQAKNWFYQLGGEKKSSEVILHAAEFITGSADSGSVAAYTEEFKDAFTELHHTVFPAAYFSADTILDRINDYNRLFILTDGETLLGYVYVEAAPEHEEGTIEFIAVDSKYRNKGAGTALLRKAGSFLFDEMNSKEISICVKAENKAAIHMYIKNGFKEKHRMAFYKIEDNF